MPWFFGANPVRSIRKSGVNIIEAQRSTVQLKLRVSAETVAQLDALCAARGRSEFVSLLIGRASKRKRSP